MGTEEGFIVEMIWYRMTHSQHGVNPAIKITRTIRYMHAVPLSGCLGHDSDTGYYTTMNWTIHKIIPLLDNAYR